MTSRNCWLFLTLVPPFSCFFWKYGLSAAITKSIHTPLPKAVTSFTVDPKYNYHRVVLVFVISEVCWFSLLLDTEKGLRRSPINDVNVFGGIKSMGIKNCPKLGDIIFGWPQRRWIITYFIASLYYQWNNYLLRFDISGRLLWQRNPFLLKNI